MSEFVVNPDTGRVIRKNGKAYKRWRRAHPQEPEPPIVDSQRKKVTRPSRRPPIYPNMDHAINPPRPTDIRPWLSTQHHPPTTTGAEDWHGCHQFCAPIVDLPPKWLALPNRSLNHRCVDVSVVLVEKEVITVDGRTAGLPVLPILLLLLICHPRMSPAMGVLE